MDSQTHQQIREQLGKSNQVGIIVGKNPSLDQMGAALGLYLGLKHMGKTVSIASPTDPIVEVSNLVGIDKVKHTLGSNSGDLTVSFPYREGEIEKVSYNLTDGFLNIVVKAGEKGLGFDESDINYKRSAKGIQTVFIIGVQRLNDIESIVTPDQLKDSTVINIDNKQENQGYGNIVAVSTQASSLSEQIADLLTLIDPGSVDTDIAQNLLSGISYATNDFQDVKTSPIAFEMAGILMKKGAVRQKREHREDRRPQHQVQHGGFVPQRPVQSRPQPQPRQPMQPRPQYQPQVNTAPVLQQQQPVHQSINPTAPTVQVQPTVQQQVPQVREEVQPQFEQTADSKEAPADWLTPKVYKGSTIV